MNYLYYERRQGNGVNSTGELIGLDFGGEEMLELMNSARAEARFDQKLIKT